MLVESSRIIPITRLQKELTQTVRELSDSGEPVYILKNNNMEAVIVPFEAYEYLANLEEAFEYFEIDEMLKKRLGSYNKESNVDWNSIRE